MTVNIFGLEEKEMKMTSVKLKRILENKIETSGFTDFF